MKVVIIGAGGHAKVLADIIRLDPTVELAGFTDPDPGKHGTDILGYPVLGGDEVVESLRADGPLGVILGVGDLELRRKLLSRLETLGLMWVNAVHPDATISESVHMGAGVAVMGGAVINCLTSIGDHAIINTNASIDHDCRIGTNVHVAPGAAIGGTCTVGESTMIGIGSRLVPRVSVGAGAVVGAGAAVVGDIPDSSLAVGVPARVTRKLTD